MKCHVRGCGGEVDESHSVSIRISGVSLSAVTHPCLKCGRLHWEHGGVVNDKFGKASLFRGKVIYERPN